MLKNLKKVLSVVLVFCMVMSMLSMTALADTLDGEPVVPAGEEVMEPAEEQADEEEAVDSAEEQDEEPDVSVDDEATNLIVTNDYTVNMETCEVAFTGTGTLSKATVNKARETLGGKKWTAVIGPGIAEIEPQAFNTWNKEFNASTEDTTLTGVVIGESVTSIGKWAFWGCTALESVTFAPGNHWTGEGNPDASFQFCKSLTHIDLPDSMTRIPAYCFAGSGLTSIDIPSGVTTIGMHAFKWCDGLTEISFPEGVKTIEELAFLECKKLTKVEFPGTLETIGKETFENCPALTTVTFNDGLKTIGNSAFNNCPKLATLNAPNGYSFPSTLETIGEYAFYKCVALDSVEFPEGLTRIDGHAFEYSNVTKAAIALPESLINMGDYVFSYGDTADVNKEIYYEGYTVHGYWSNSRVFCLNGGTYSYEAKAPVADKYGHTFVGWHKVDPMNPDELEKIDELDKSSLVRGEDGEPAGIDEVGNTKLFPAGFYYFAEWSCNFETSEDKPDCLTPGKVVKKCITGQCGVTVVAELPALGHKWSETPVGEPKTSTTTEDGITHTVVKKNYPCIRCDKEHWEEEETWAYTVTYLDGDKTVGTQSYAAGDTITPLADLTKEGDTFKGWAGLPETMTMPANPLVVTAQWDKIQPEPEKPDPNPEPETPEEPEPVMCTVTFNSHGGSFLNSKTRSNDEVKVEVPKGSTVGEKMPDVELDGYELTGWQDEEGKEFTAETPVQDDMTVYAQWKEIEKPDTGDKSDTTEPAPKPGFSVTVLPIVPVTPSQPKDEDIPNNNPPMSEEPDDEDIPDDNLPMGEMPDDEDILDNEPPMGEMPDDEDILDDEPPLAGNPPVQEDEDILDNEPPMAGNPPVQEDEDDEEIADGDAPLADVPQTGDQLVFWLGAAALSGSGLILVSAVSRKRKEEDGE